MTTKITLRETGTEKARVTTLSIEDSQAGINDSIELEDADLENFHAIQKRYQDIPKAEDGQQTLLELGNDLYQCLNQNDTLSHLINAMPTPPWNIEFLLETLPQSDFQKSFPIIHNFQPSYSR